MIVDAHTHIFSPEFIDSRENLCALDRRFCECYASPKARMKTAAELIATMDLAGIDKAVVTGYAFEDGAMCAASNDYVIQAVKEYPERLVGLATVQPRDGEKAALEAERCFSTGLRGLGELTAGGQDFDITDPTLFHDLAGLVEKHRGVIMVHTSEPVGPGYPGKDQTTPDKIIKFAQNFSNCTIIAAHWGGGLPFYELMPKVAAGLTNVYYDTAATTYLYNFGVFRAVCDSIGAGRILWGSDWPLLGQARLLQRVRDEGRLTEQEFEMITGGNAARLWSQ